MPGLVPGPNVCEPTNKEDVDGRDTPGTKCPGAAMTRRWRLTQVAQRAEAVRVVAHVVVVAEPRGGVHRIGLAGEGAAAQHAQLTIAARPGGAVARRVAIGFVPAILDPFGGIAGGVVEPERIGPERTARQRARGRTA